MLPILIQITTAPQQYMGGGQKTALGSSGFFFLSIVWVLEIKLKFNQQVPLPTVTPFWT